MKQRAFWLAAALVVPAGAAAQTASDSLEVIHGVATAVRVGQAVHCWSMGMAPIWRPLRHR
jgi:hypothetical protein